MLRNPFKVIDEKLRKKYGHSERMYRFMKSSLWFFLGWGISLLLFIIRILEELC